MMIPEYTDQLKKDTYRDARLNWSLSIEEFIVAFNKYKRIHCTRHAWCKAELDAYEASIIEISHVYVKKFYEYHKIFSQNCAMALEQRKKVNWAEKDKDLLHTHYHNSNLIWRTVSRRVDEVIPSDHPRRVASRVIQWYGLIHET